jgi:DNA-binding transcriptional MerR regulator
MLDNLSFSKGYPRAEEPERRNNGRAYYRASCVSSQRLALRTARMTRSLADIAKFLERLRNARQDAGELTQGRKGAKRNLKQKLAKETKVSRADNRLGRFHLPYVVCRLYCALLLLLRSLV